jgi:hypothetical protein
MSQDQGEEENESLVAEVLRDFPAEEKGEREEWNQHIGWHRQENIHDKHATRDTVRYHNQLSTEEKVSFSGGKPKLRSGGTVSGGHASHGPSSSPSIAIQMMLGAMVLAGFIISRLLRKRTKGRTL